jgi:hypothetical protein
MRVDDFEVKDKTVPYISVSFDAGLAQRHGIRWQNVLVLSLLGFVGFIVFCLYMQPTPLFRFGFIFCGVPFGLFLVLFRKPRILAGPLLSMFLLVSVVVTAGPRAYTDRLNALFTPRDGQEHTRSARAPTSSEPRTRRSSPRSWSHVN